MVLQLLIFTYLEVPLSLITGICRTEVEIHMCFNDMHIYIMNIYVEEYFSKSFIYLLNNRIYNE